MRSPAAIALLLLARVPALLAAEQQSAQSTPGVSTIVATGEATVRRAPDQAFVTIAVETRARSPKEAQQLNASAMSAVQSRVSGAGIARDAVRTTGYSIQQEFDFANGRRTPRGFVARNGLEVRVDAIERIGELLDLVVDAGATNVSGVRFDLKDRGAAEREALRLAVADARARADAMAAGAGRSVDRVLRIEDSNQPKIRYPQPMALERAAVAGAEPTPIEAGDIEIHAQVTLTASLE